MQIFRQLLLIVSLMFWQGGFMFYGGIVIPTGARILGSDAQQAMITRSVTNWLNVAGVICLVIWAENLWNDRQHDKRIIEWVLLSCIAAALVFLAIDHKLMDLQLDSDDDSLQFGLLHKAYIGISSLQWMACLTLLLFTLNRWNERRAVI